MVPPIRLGAILRSIRESRGWTTAQVAEATGYRFEADGLGAIEGGARRLSEPELVYLASIYELETSQIVPQRMRLVVDLDHRVIASGSEQTELKKKDTEPRQILERYLDLIYALRGRTAGGRIPLRDDDVAVLATALQLAPSDVHGELTAMMEAVPRKGFGRFLKAGLIIPAAGILVGVTGIGSLILEPEVDAAGAATTVEFVSASSDGLAEVATAPDDAAEPAEVAATDVGPVGLVGEHTGRVLGEVADQPAPSTTAPSTTEAPAAEVAPSTSAPAPSSTSTSEAPTTTAAPETTTSAAPSTSFVPAPTTTAAPAPTTTAAPTPATTTTAASATTTTAQATPTTAAPTTTTAAPATTTTAAPTTTTAAPTTTAPAPTTTTAAPTTTTAAPTTTTTEAEFLTTAAVPHYQAVGQGALERIAYDWQEKLPGWQIKFLPARAGYLGGTMWQTKTIEVYIRNSHTVDQVAVTLAHELGHAVDIELNSEADRAAWRAERGIRADMAWWGESGASDYATPSGDFAEAFAAWQVGAYDFRSQLAGAPDGGDISLLAALARA